MRTSAQLILQQVESALAKRNTSPFSRKVRSADTTCFGISALDSLTSGVPVGALTEMVGPESSGRTTAALSAVSALVHGGGVCAWVDVSDTFDPESAAANGLNLEKLLWVRCGGYAPSSVQQLALAAKNIPVPTDDPPPLQPAPLGCGSPHPRSEGRNMPEAVAAMLQTTPRSPDGQTRRSKRLIGTPGAPNRPVSYRSQNREEQVNSDRMPARRGDNLAILPRCAEPQHRQAPNPHSIKPGLVKQSDLRAGSTVTPSLWKPLDQAIRSTDLLLHNGGFSAIVLDLGGVPPEFSWRVPLATWFRFRAACERTRTSLILLTQHPCARSSAELVLRLQPGKIEAHAGVMSGVQYQAEVERSRFAESEPRVVPIRKPPQSERPGQWKSGAAWV